MIAIIDYGVGNLFSLTSSLKFLGMDAKSTNKKEDLIDSDRIILPGVGAFSDAIEKLKNTGLVEAILEQADAGKPILGICIGMQLLFQKSYEYGEHEGLGLIGGVVGSIEEDLTGEHPLKVPHIGWNSLTIHKNDPILKYTKEGDYMYYVHSFYAKQCLESIIASSNYDIQIPGVVKHKNIYGTQFHPEKSGAAGLRILSAFGEIRGRNL